MKRSSILLLASFLLCIIIIGIHVSAVTDAVIRINPIGDMHVGDKFTITAATDLAANEEILVQVYSSSYNQNSQSGEFSGATGIVKVAKGYNGDNRMNKISFDVDASTFKRDEYKVYMYAKNTYEGTSDTALFKIIDNKVPTVVPPNIVASSYQKPVININTVGDKHIGDKFTITALTNLPAGSEILVKVYSTSTNGATGTVKVIKSNSDMNEISFDVDASTFKQGDYIVNMGCVSQSVSGSIRFNILDPTSSKPDITISPTKSINQLLEEQNKKIDEQSGLLDQIMRMFKSLFGQS
jgi:hypothetical protein